MTQTGCETSSAPVSLRAGDDVGLDVQGRHHAEEHGEDAADEDGEEVVNARSAAAQAIEALQEEAERHDDDDERQDVDVLPKRRNALGNRNQAGLEAQRVGDDEGGQAEERVGDDVKRDEQAVVSNHRAAPWPAGLFTRASISIAEALAAESFGVPANRARVERAAHGVRDRVGERLGREVVDEQAGFARDARFRAAPPRPSATTGRPHA